MGIVIVEFVTGGGEYLVEEPGGFSSELVIEGIAMRDAVARSLSRIAPEPVVVFQTSQAVTPLSAGVVAETIENAEQFWSKLTSYSQLQSQQPGANGILPIAPETDGWLSRLTRQIEKSNGTVLGPDSTWVDLCSDKTATLERLQAHQVPIPWTHLSSSSGWLVKPRFGCGSEGIRSIAGSSIPSEHDFPRQQWHIEPRGSGMPASIACLCSSKGFQLLPPFEQCFRQIDPWHYSGGRRLMRKDLVERCERLGKMTLEALPATRGYVGIDLLLGETADKDVVLEVNPRLTTSWVGLAKCLGDSLGQAWCSMFEDRPSLIEIQQEQVAFSIDGATDDLTRELSGPTQ